MIKVTCAIIMKDGQILLAQRSEKMSLPLKWEFPGGKIEPNESPNDCIKREILEELGYEIEVQKELQTCIHQEGDKTIELIPFICTLKSGSMLLAEHKAAVWLDPKKGMEYDLAKADIQVLNQYLLLE